MYFDLFDTYEQVEQIHERKYDGTASKWGSGSDTNIVIGHGAFEVDVQTLDGEGRTAVLSLASVEDMPSDWWFDWPGLWQLMDFDCQQIAKLSMDGQTWGLMRYGLYPYPGPPAFLEIEQVEANPTSRGTLTTRPLRPIGKWLIWYAVQLALHSDLSQESETLVVLTGLDSDLDYYGDTIQMEYITPITIAPGEKGHVFRFTATDAARFCLRQQEQWGQPRRL